MSVAEKSFDPLDRTLTLVDAKDDLDPFSFEDGVLKAQLSCGHVVSAESLTDSCRAQLDEGNYKFKCTAIVDGRLCNQPLSYREVRRLADLTVEEMLYFEENIAHLAAADYTDVQTCPKCRTNIERMDMSNLCVECSVCSADQEESYLFCWQCLKPWTGPAPRSDRCANPDCRNFELQLLRTCSGANLLDNGVSMGGQGRTGSGGAVKLVESGSKVERRLTIYRELYLHSVQNPPKSDSYDKQSTRAKSEIQKVPEAKCPETDYYHNTAKSCIVESERFEQTPVSSSRRDKESEQREIAGQVEGHIETLPRTGFERVDKITEGDTEIIKITVNKRQSGNAERQNRRSDMCSVQSDRNAENLTNTIAEDVDNLTIS